ncbi:unnamed protein product (macronuclear) [Paramecium tetraurelia]|uniref:Uncharacterized protein n=1 Tax=Paramecium tetraurelia TaxID=5888 RepID=A0D1S0_PARTE|nr:uncharacterized protein GSPATT00012511001 [Paramecium tetraurelia]CAK76987.1 unnamed protein product [Paramecium tetraurelia]|eukprot:XP_001444384.1 hypothetical protein (macronuclear) [Paramecium tetraurelia strain d4-2]
MFEQQFLEQRKSKQEQVVNTKSRHLIVMNQLKKKEENWNNRFYVQNQNKNESVEKQKPKQIHNTSKLIEIQDYYNIPEFHRQLFLMCLQTLPKNNQAIQFEIEEMQQKKSHIQLCMQAVEAREKCLAFLINHIHQIQDNPGDEQLLQKSAELITHLRILSINVVEQILGWRQYLMKFLVNIHSHESISLPYLYLRENYLIKMRKDIQYITNSILSNYYQFSIKPDPFFVAITKSAEDPNKIVQFISKPLLKRIKNCEIMIQDEVNSICKDDRSIHNQANSKDKIQMSPEKAIQPGRIRPPKRQEQSQNQKHHDQNEISNQQQNSVPKNIPLRQINKQGSATPQKQNSVKVTPHDSNHKQQAQQSPPQSDQKQSSSIHAAGPTVEQQNLFTEDDDTFKVKKCQLSDQNVIDHLNNINEDFKKSWRGEIQLMQNQYDQQDDSFCLGIYFKDQMLALGQCYLDQSLQERKLILSHFSTADPLQFQKLLKVILQFIWEIDPCLEIRMSLYHYNQNDSFQANKEITTKLKELGFKWKVVQSVNSETRFTVMAIRRPSDLDQPKQFDPIFLQHLYLTCDNNTILSTDAFTSLYCLTTLNTKVDLDDEIIHQHKENLISSEFGFKGIKLQEQTSDEFHAYTKQYFEGFDQLNPFISEVSLSSNKVISSFCKECYRWAKCKLAQHQRHIYNGFHVAQNADNAKVFMSDSGSIKVYLISTDQSSTSIFVFECKFMKYVIDNDEISLQKIQSILNQCGAQVPIDQNLYIPQFIVNSKVKFSENVIGLGRFSTAYRPKMVDIQNAQGYIMKPPFIFGMINEDFNEVTGMPNLFFKVQDTHCIQL